MKRDVSQDLRYQQELVHINTDWTKLSVHERLRWPLDQPGGFYLCADISEDYVFQLLSEARLRTASRRPL